MTSSKFKVDEKISGLKVIHRVDSDITYAGSKRVVEGGKRKTKEMIIFRRIERYSSVFNRNVNFVTFYKIIKKSAGNDESVTLYLKVRNSVIVNKDPRREKEPLRCVQFTRDLAKKEWNPIASIGFYVMAGPVPLKFAIGVTAGLKLSASLLLCYTEEIVALQLVAGADFGVVGEASLSIIIASVGLQVKVGSGLEASYTVGYSKERMCHAVRIEWKPLQVVFSAFGSLFWFKKSVELFSWSPVLAIMKLQMEKEEKWVSRKNRYTATEYKKKLDEAAEEKFKSYTEKTLLSQCEHVDTEEYTEPEKPFETKKPPVVIQFDFEFAVPKSAEEYTEKTDEYRSNKEFTQ